jgi:hypothetical protein
MLYNYFLALLKIENALTLYQQEHELGLLHFLNLEYCLRYVLWNLRLPELCSF